MTSNSAFGFACTDALTNPEGNPMCFSGHRGLSYQEIAGTVKQKKRKARWVAAGVSRFSPAPCFGNHEDPHSMDFHPFGCPASRLPSSIFPGRGESTRERGRGLISVQTF